MPRSFYAAIGLRAIGGIALRPDRLERIAAAVRRRARQGPFTADAELASAAGLDPEALRLLVSALGYRALIDAGGETFAAPRRRRRELDPNRRPTPCGPRRPSVRKIAGAETRLMADPLPAPQSRRLDQWLWFARFAKSRSLAARLCAAGAVTVNGAPVGKANHAIRVGDAVAVPRGAWHYTVRVLALGVRRSPAIEARLLYEDIAAPIRLRELAPAWTLLLVDEDETELLRAEAE